MKATIFILLIGFIFSSISYNPSLAIKYAKQYCKNYNPAYKRYKGLGCDCSNFVSQCLIAGGLDLRKCEGLDEKGSVKKTANLKACLTKMGWKSKQGIPKQFKAGYPFFQGDMHARIATAVNGKEVTYCDHKECGDNCNSKITNDNLYYYYLSD